MQPDRKAEPLRVLIVEDRETDAELIVREMRKNGYDPQWTLVDTEAAYLRHIHEPFDLITADAVMPQFSAFRAVTLLQDHGIDIPCIVISGSIGEEEAVALMRAGASDYLMKDRLGRLGQAIRHVRDQRKLREEHRQAHKALVALNEELERRIAERTVELENLNESLAQELVERRQIEVLLRQHEASLERHVSVRTAQLEHSRKMLRRLAFQLTLTEAAERKRLATDLHDYLAQLLVVSKLRLSQRRKEANTGAVEDVLREVETYIDEALTYTRTLVTQISPSVLVRHGLVAAVKWLAEYMRPHGLTVTVTCRVDRVPMSEQHAGLLFQSVRELLFNVVKHARTPTAEVELDVSEGQILTIAVRDRGIGFVEHAVSEEASQFGLFSTRERIEVMGGTFVLRTAPGKGTDIQISLPLHESETSEDGRLPGADHVAGVSPGLPPTEADLRKWRVLIVDDHELLRRELVDVLKTMNNLEIAGEAADGAQAITLAAALRPDLILMDVNMPSVDGIEATRRILAQYPDTRIIGVTIQNDPTSLARLSEAGAIATVSKDILHIELEPVIRRALGCG